MEKSRTEQSLSRGGVFEASANRLLEEFTQSVSFDRRLAAFDIRASCVHAEMLARQGIVGRDEAQAICQELEKIGNEIDSGDFQFKSELEDVHMNIERALIDRLGDVGRKLHTARSRNDQVSTDLRLWVRESVDRIDQRIAALQEAFVRRCERDEGVILPGYTHLQRAQPILAAHYWLAYCEKLDRDRRRLADCRTRANVLTLGTAALAGTTLPIDREFVAGRLEFEGVAANSLDASSDRDFVTEFAFVLAMIAEHLSTWAEEWIIWSTSEFGFLRLPQEFCTGSSIMPQKVNPDVLELIRGKAARVIGNLTTLLVLVKALPLAYNRDLQEDKPPLFDSYDTVHTSLELAAAIVAGAELNREAIAQRLDRGHLDATTLMESLIRRGLPQRTAHALVGTLVRKAMSKGVRLGDLPLADFQEACPELDAAVYDSLGVENAVNSFVSYGSTAPGEVKRQIETWRKKLNTANHELHE